MNDCTYWPVMRIVVRNSSETSSLDSQFNQTRVLMNMTLHSKETAVTVKLQQGKKKQEIKAITLLLRWRILLTGE
jgi:hypothetical protein